MMDDNTFSDLFAGKPGTVLGEQRELGAAEQSKRKAAKGKRRPQRRDHGPRVPPGQEIVDKWPILDLGQRPHVPTDQWTLEIKGAVERPLKLDWDAFHALPQSRINADIHCVTAWSLLDNEWEGVSSATLLNIFRPLPSAKHLIFHAHDGYRTNVPLARFAEANSLLAHKRNGEDISRDHGGPIRPVIPSLYFWKSAKWVRQITVLENDVKGYWEALGYHNNGDPWKEERYE